MDVFPDFEGLSGISELREIAGALLMFVLVVAVLMVIVSAIAWAIGAANGNLQMSTKGRIGVLVSLGGAILAGGAVAWLNWLVSVGQQL